MKSGYFEVSKSYEFSYAHRLVQGYPDKCRFIHGHTGLVTIFLRSKNDQLNQYGFVRDFKDFKQLKKWIDDNWDHALLISKDDKSLLDFVQMEGQKHFVFSENPSSEAMAKEIFFLASKYLNQDNCEVVRVEINESCTSCAAFSIQS